MFHSKAFWYFVVLRVFQLKINAFESRYVEIITFVGRERARRLSKIILFIWENRQLFTGIHAEHFTSLAKYINGIKWSNILHRKHTELRLTLPFYELIKALSLEVPPVRRSLLLHLDFLSSKPFY